MSAYLEGAWSVWSDRYYGILLPWCARVADRLELPEWDVYQDSLQACAADTWRAAVSAYRLGYLTVKPMAILSWILLGHFWNFVLEHGGRSLYTLAVHFQLACLHFYRFQRSLNATQLVGEAGLIGLCVGLYYLRKWLQKQTYWAKFVQWYKAKKRRLIQSYTDTVHQIAEVSKIMAMALPHSLFLGLVVGLTMAFPGAIRWVTYETPTLSILTIYYPLMSTLLWVHSQRHDYDWGSTSESETESNSEIESDTKEEGDTEGDATNGTSKPTKKAKSRIAERKQKFETKVGETNKSSSTSSSSSSSAPGFVTQTAALATTKYWLQYWQIYAVIQAFGSCFSMVPLVGRFLVSHPMVGFLTGECKLFFFVWIFGMEKLLGKTSKDAFLAEALPLRLLHKLVTPLVVQLHAVVSDAISKELWQKWVVSKTQTTLEIAVMVRLLSKERKEWLLHVVDEARVLTLPSITLLMPGFVTQFGVAYVQYMVPSAKSGQAKSQSKKLVYLQYWILHCGTAGFLEKLGGILWWVPFSTHMIFLLWSYLVLPPTIQSWYGVFESELLAFGILPQGETAKTSAPNDDGASIQTIHDTKTARLFQSLVRRLPSAAAEVDQEEQNDKAMDSSGDSKQSSLSDGPAELSSSSPEATTSSRPQGQSKNTQKVVEEPATPPPLTMEATQDETVVDEGVDTMPDQEE